MLFRLIVMIIVFLASLTAFLLYQQQQAASEQVNLVDNLSPLTQDYDSFMLNVDRHYYTLEGQVDYRILGDRFTHFPNPDFTQIEAPNYILYHQTEQPWYISADHGILTNDTDLIQDKIELSQNVVIHRVDATGRSVDIYTEFLTILPETKYVSTELAVRIVTEDSETLGLGMTADLDKNNINLLANVRGRYESPNRN